jgi:hypothetical protein
MEKNELVEIKANEVVAEAELSMKITKDNPFSYCNLKISDEFFLFNSKLEL